MPSGRKQFCLPGVLIIIVACAFIAGCGDDSGPVFSPPGFGDPQHPADSSHPPAVRIVSPQNGQVFHAPANIRFLVLATPYGTSLDPDASTKRFTHTNDWNFSYSDIDRISVTFLAGTNQLGSAASGLTFAGMRERPGQFTPMIMVPVGFPRIDWVWSQVPAGSYILTARAINNNGAATVSIPVTVTVLP